MNSIKWAKALQTIRSGKKAVCPECGKAEITAEYTEIVKDEGMVRLACPSCGKGLHFSHQKSL